MRPLRLRKQRIPNTLAVAGALLLAVSVIAGGHFTRPHETAGPTALASAVTEPVGASRAPDEAVSQSAVRKSQKKFRVKLFLFRR